MLETIIPITLSNAINFNINKNYLYEIRIRANKPIVINYLGKYEFLGINGIVKNREEAIYLTDKDIKEIILKASNYSIYAVNEQIKQGYICVNKGIRIGICGQLVVEDNKIITIKNINSINIRIPHQILNCSINSIPYITEQDRILNTLIISPPGAGKTTYIRDICYQLSKKNVIENVLVLDERNEIVSVGEDNTSLNLGDFCDVLTNCTKIYGFKQGIRSMRPDLIVTDEIGGKEDVDAIEYASKCGVKILATIHASSINDLKLKDEFKKCLNQKIFKRYVVLSNRNGPMTYEGIFDENFKCIWIS